MRHAETLKEFLKHTIIFVGSGYTNFKIVRIPEEKTFKLPEITKKISNDYQTVLTRSMRSKKRLKNLANYSAIRYKNFILILRTSGEHQDRENEFNPIGKKLELELTQHIGVILFKDERDVWTIRLNKNTFAFFRNEFFISFKNRDGKKFHTLKKMLDNLPHYVGIGKQKKDMYGFFREWKKTYKTQWNT
jgi:hypothetical protein